jgi:hypothetical protein
MSDTCDIYTVAGLTLNAETGDTLVVENVTGLGGAPIRRTKPPQGQGDGAILLTSKKQYRTPMFSGFILIRSVEWEDDPDAYRTAQRALMDTWKAALEGIDNASSTLAWTGHSLTVYRDAGPEFTGPEFGKKFTFSLYAPNPTIS